MARTKPRRSLWQRWKCWFSEHPVLYMIETMVSLALIAGLVYGFCYFLSQAPEFHVHTIRVEGIEMLSEDSIIAHSGLSSEDCIFFINPRTVRDRLLALPYVGECTVTRIFPDKVIIAIHERVALATLFVENRLFELDQDCTVLRELQPGEKHVDPLITGVADTGAVEVGQRLTQKPLRAALGVWRAFCRTDVARALTVSEISAAQENRLCMYCDELKSEIRWARGDFAKQAWKLDFLWRKQHERLPYKDYIDLRFNDDVVCK